MKKILILLLLIPLFTIGQTEKKDYKAEIKKIFKFSVLFMELLMGEHLYLTKIYIQ